MLSTLQQLIAYEAWADAQYLHVLFIYERVYADEGIYQNRITQILECMGRRQAQRAVNVDEDVPV